jgi:hypothetical protein
MDNREPLEQKLSDAVDQFAEAMKNKLHAKQDQGKFGWEDADWGVEDVKDDLYDHIIKGDPIDCANYVLFWWSKEMRGTGDRRKPWKRTGV